MKKEQFLDTARRLCYDESTRYQLGGIGQHEGKTWLFDCGGLIKSILWGFNFDYNQSRGGAIYGSNGVPDVGCDEFFKNYCYNISNDFTNIEDGELVWMSGHIGIYNGNRKVIESTSAWDNRVLQSEVGNNGERTYYGKQVYNWTHHGKCKFIDYSAQKMNLKYKVGDRVILNGYLHTGTMSGSGDVGKYENYKCTITKVETNKCDYPYYVDNLGWCRESYLTLDTTTDYEQLYKKELLKTKDLDNQVSQLKNKVSELEKSNKTLQEKINNAIKTLK